MMDDQERVGVALSLNGDEVVDDVADDAIPPRGDVPSRCLIGICGQVVNATPFLCGLSILGHRSGRFSDIVRCKALPHKSMLSRSSYHPSVHTGNLG
ncbi:hypothetical protein PRIC1_005469 [Phytophthora ramorum]